MANPFLASRVRGGGKLWAKIKTPLDLKPTPPTARFKGFDCFVGPLPVLCSRKSSEECREGGESEEDLSVHHQQAA